MTDIRLSVIVPVYNTGKYLVRCLDSLQNQSLKNIEIIIINDGSTDESDKIITEYAKNYSRIKYVNLDKNHGAGYARNIGIKTASAKYISFVDSDDWVDLDLYEIMCTTLDNDKTDIAICGIKNEYDNSLDSEIRYEYYYPNVINSDMLLNLLTKTTNNNYYISPVVWNKVYKRSIFSDDNLSFLNNSFWEDDIFTFLLFSKINYASIVPNVYYHYYMRPNSITNSISKKHIDDIISSFISLKYELSSIEKPNIIKKYNALFDRCICSLIKMIVNNEPTVNLQKKYISYLFKQFSKYFSIEKAIEFLDINRIERIFI